MGVINGQGEARRLLEDCRKMRVVQLAYASALGLTACARAALGSLTHEKPVLDLEAFRSDDASSASSPSEFASRVLGARLGATRPSAAAG